MVTRITVPEIGAIEIDSDLVPDKWADDTYSYYMNSKPPYVGESPGKENYYEDSINGRKVLIFSQRYLGAICMFVNEQFIDMDCVYDCESITLTYGGMPYGCMECGYQSIEEMLAFYQEILSLFIDLKIVIPIEGFLNDKYYIIPDYEEYIPLKTQCFRREQGALWSQEIEPKIANICTQWLQSKIKELLDCCSAN